MPTLKMKKQSKSTCRPGQLAGSKRGPAVAGSVRLTVCLATSLIAAVPCPAQSLWKDNSSQNMVSDKRAHAIGDVVTILIQENNSAVKNNSTSTDKKSSVDASISSFLYSPGASGFMTQGGQMPALKYNSGQAFSGGGKIDNLEKITARIAVRVVDVLPNGNLVLEGTKHISFAGESQDAILRGVVRQEDITANNMVYSYNVSDASIKYVSKGTISDAQRKGWFTKLWDKLTPF
jgi:flagellar L-ring protein FlgH